MRSTDLSTRRLARVAGSLLFAGGLSLAEACLDQPTAPGAPGTIALLIVSGDSQSGEVGTELPAPLVVRAIKPTGTPLPNLTVDFRVTSGAGTMWVAATSTDDGGYARNYWTLGTSTAQAQTVEVRTILIDGTKLVLGTFHASPRPGPATAMTIRQGNGQAAPWGTWVVVPPAVRVADRFNNPVPGVPVTFGVLSGGGRVIGPNQTSDAFGVATVGRWILGTTPGPNVLQAASPGISSALINAQGQSNVWRTWTPMPTPRIYPAAGSIGGRLYVSGGQGPAASIVATLEAYDPSTDTWSKMAPMPTARSVAGAGVVNGILYVIGGWTGTSALGTVQAYDPGTNSWTTKRPMPTPRYALAVSEINGVLYAIGGASQSGTILTTVEAYDPINDRWTSKAPLNVGRYVLAAASIDGVFGYVYALGGLPTTRNLDALDPIQNTWSSRASIPHPRARLAAGVINGTLYAVGGEGSGVEFDAYDAVRNTWSSKASAPTHREALAAGVINGVLYAVGGGLNIYATPQGTLQAYYP